MVCWLMEFLFSILTNEDQDATIALGLCYSYQPEKYNNRLINSSVL